MRALSPSLPSPSLPRSLSQSLDVARALAFLLSLPRVLSFALCLAFSLALAHPRVLSRSLALTLNRIHQNSSFAPVFSPNATPATSFVPLIFVFILREGGVEIKGGWVVGGGGGGVVEGEPNGAGPCQGLRSNVVATEG